MPLIIKALASLGAAWFAVEYAERSMRASARRHPYNADDRRLDRLLGGWTAGFSFFVILLAIWSA